MNRLFMRNLNSEICYSNFSARRSGEDHQIKATPGITGWYRPSVHSDGGVRHLDVGSPYPGTEEGPKGLAVRQLKGYASWVSKNEPSVPSTLKIENISTVKK